LKTFVKILNGFVCSEFERLLNSYVRAVSRGAIRPSAGFHIKDNLLNNNDRFMTVFVPVNSAMDRITAYENERYHAMSDGVDPLLLQKVTTLCPKKTSPTFSTVS